MNLAHQKSPPVAEAQPAKDGRFDHRSLRIWIDLVVLLVQRDLRVRYRGSFLGYVWSMMNPLLYMGVLSFVFSHIMKFQIEHFSMFILSGILVWNVFHQGMVIGVNSIVANGALLRKVNVPATLFPAASVCSVLVNFALALGPYLLIALATGVHLTRYVLLLPVVLVPYLVFTFGMVLLVASLNVSFRDVGHVLEPLLTMVFYATPVVYPIDRLPDRYRQLIGLNPVVHYLDQIRLVIFDGRPPAPSAVGLTCLLALVSLAVGGFAYRKYRDRFIYNL